jgi:hypothetical protein
MMNRDIGRPRQFVEAHHVGQEAVSSCPASQLSDPFHWRREHSNIERQTLSSYPADRRA